VFPALINDWRERWGRGPLPFLFVQLAGFMAVQTEPVQISAQWPFLREAQFLTLALTNTAMACATDIGDADNIHPANKQEVGRRLALAARAVAYGERVVYSGPQFRTAARQGSTMTVTFNHIDGGLTTSDGATVRGVAVAGADRVWHWADAIIVSNRLIVRARGVNAPAAVRYNWANNPIGNLCNREGLPAPPFRSDNW
jgi:sialate O-acetylesterase